MRANRAHTRSLAELLRRINNPQPKVCEVGVLEAENCCPLAEMEPEAQFWLIDPYQPVGDKDVHREIGGWSQEQFSGAMLKAIGRMRPFSSRVQWIFAKDYEAAEFLPDRFFDLVFLDHLHDLDSMNRSLPIWTKKVSSRGFLSGHDYGGLQDRRGHGGVKEAVDRFFGDCGMDVETMSGNVWAVRL